MYYRGTGASRDEFVYLFDYILRYQILRDARRIDIRLPFPADDASTNFAQAKEEYVHAFADLNEFRERLNRCTYSSVNTVKLQFSAEEIGMKRD